MSTLEQGCPWCEGQVDWCETVFPDDHGEGEVCNQVACPQCGYSLDILSAVDKEADLETQRDLVAERWNRRHSVEWREAFRYAAATARDMNLRLIEAEERAAAGQGLSRYADRAETNAAIPQDLRERLAEAEAAAAYWENKYRMMHRKFGMARLQRNVERACAERFRAALQRCEGITQDRQVKALVERTFVAVYGKGVRH